MKNQDFYDLKRKVLSIINQVKKMIPFEVPWVEIKIANKNDQNSRVLGVGNYKKPAIIILEGMDEGFFFQVVLHELCHTWFQQEHIDGCPLMSPVISLNHTNNEYLDLFLGYAKKYEQNNKKLDKLSTCMLPFINKDNEVKNAF